MARPRTKLLHVLVSYSKSITKSTIYKVTDAVTDEDDVDDVGDDEMDGIRGGRKRLIILYWYSL